MLIPTSGDVGIPSQTTFIDPVTGMKMLLIVTSDGVRIACPVPGINDNPAGPVDPVDPVIEDLIDIVVERSALSITPDSVHFTTDLSRTDFDNQKPANDEDYDPSFHDIEYFWTFDTVGETFDKPVNVMLNWRDANVAFGPDVRKMYTTAGTYDVSVVGYERSSGKVYSGSTQVVVGDADASHTGAQTHVMAADNDYQNAPAGAQHATLAAAFAAMNTGSGDRVRLLLKRGGTYTFAGTWDILNSTPDHIMIDAWGTGADPILDLGPDPAVNIAIRISHNPFDHPRRDFRVNNIAWRGTWDQTDPLAGNARRTQMAMFFNNMTHTMINGGGSDGLTRFFLTQGSSDAIPEAYRFHANDFESDNYKDYDFFFGPLKGSRVSFTGVRATANPLGMSAFPVGMWDEQGGATIRINGSDTYTNCCDIYHNIQHGTSDTSTPQPAMKLNDQSTTSNSDTSSVDGYRLNIQQSTFESAGTPITIQAGNNAYASTRIHGMIDKCMLIGGHSTLNALHAKSRGSTLQNSIIITPNAEVGANKLLYHVLYQDNSSTTTVSADDKSQIRNCALALNRTFADNFSSGTSAVPILAQNSSTHNNFEEDNVLWTPETAATLNVDLTSVGFDARTPGRVRPSDGVLEANLATPSGELRRYASSVDVAGDGTKVDFKGDERTSPVKIAAWQ